MTSSIYQVYLLPIKLQNIYLLGRSISLLPLMMSSLFKLFFIFQNWEKLSLSLSLSRPKKGSNFNQLRFFIKTFLKRLSPNQNSNSILCKLIFPLCGCVTSLMTTTVGINPPSHEGNFWFLAEFYRIRQAWANQANLSYHFFNFLNKFLLFSFFCFTIQWQIWQTNNVVSDQINQIEIMK